MMKGGHHTKRSNLETRTGIPPSPTADIQIETTLCSSSMSSSAWNITSLSILPLSAIAFDFGTLALSSNEGVPIMNYDPCLGIGGLRAEQHHAQLESKIDSVGRTSVYPSHAPTNWADILIIVRNIRGCGARTSVDGWSADDYIYLGLTSRRS